MRPFQLLSLLLLWCLLLPLRSLLLLLLLLLPSLFSMQLRKLLVRVREWLRLLLLLRLYLVSS